MILSSICLALVVLAMALQLYGYFFISDRSMKDIVGWMIIPFGASLAALVLLLTPLAAFRYLRPLLQPGFALAATVLFICLLWGSSIYLHLTWGAFWVTIGLFFMMFGCIPLGMLAALLTGDWLILALYLICLASLAGSSYAAWQMAEERDEPKSKAVEAPPGYARDATQVVWISLCFLLSHGIYSTGEPYWAWLIPVIVIIALGLGNSHRWAYVAYLALVGAYLWLLYDKPELLTLRPDFRILDASKEYHQLINGFSSYLTLALKINSGIQHAVAVYAAGLLLTPSAIRWFWSPRLQVEEAGPDARKDGEVIDEYAPPRDEGRQLDLTLDDKE